MARKNINIGSGINTGTGDTLRNAMSKVNDNFEELYNNVFGGDSTVLDLKATSITATNTNGTLTLSVNGSGQIILDAEVVFNQQLRSDDSTGIDIADDVRIEGSLRFGSDGQSVSAILDEDAFGSDSDTALATQQSIKAYVDAQVTSAGALTLVDDTSTTVDINLAQDSLTIAGGTGITTAISGDTLTITGLELLDEDNMSSNSATAVASQQSIKAYVDSQITSTNTLTVADDTSTTISVNLDNTLTVTGGDSITTSVAGQAVTIDLDENITVNQISSTDSTEVQVGDNLVPTTDNTYALGSADKKWSALHVAGGSIFLGDLVLKDNGDNTLGVFQSDGTTPADLQGVTQITFVGDDSTGTAFNLDETIKIAGAGSATTSVSGDVITVTVTETNDLGAAVTWVDVPDANITQGSVTQHQSALSITQSQISDFNSPITIVGDDSTGVTLNTGETIKIAGAQNITTAVSGDTLTITGPNISSFITSATLEFVGDDSTGTVFNAGNGDNVKFAGANGIAVSVSGDTITVDGSALTTSGGLTFVGDDSTGTVVSLGETFKFAGAGTVSTAVSGDVLTITGTAAQGIRFYGDDSAGIEIADGGAVYIQGGTNITTATNSDGTVTINGPANVSQLNNDSGFISDISIKIVGDDSATVELNNNATILFNGEQNITTSTTSDGVVKITGPDLSSYITASSSDALTNKTIDANGTGNSITNLEVADFAAGVVDTDLSTVSASDDTLASAKAIKAYVDSVSGGTITLGDDASNSGSVDINGNQDLEFHSGNSITGTVTGNGVTYALNDAIVVNAISSADSTAVVFNDGADINGNVSISGDLQVATISSPDSVKIIVNDGLDVNGNANFSNDVEVYGTLYVNNIQGEDSTQLTINQNLDVLGVMRVRELQSEDSTQVLINDGLRVGGALNVQGGAEIYGTLYAQQIGAEDSTQLTFIDDIQVNGTSSTINDLVITTNDVDTVTVSTQGGEDLVLDADTGDIRVEANLTQFTANVQIDGNLTVNGTETIVNTTNLQIEDNQIVLARNNSADVVDIGFFGHTYPAGFDSTVPNHVGFFRDATNAEWYLIATYSKNEDQLTIDRTDPSFGLATLNTLNINTGDVTATGSFIIGSANLNETDITKIDGITNGTGAVNKALVLDGSGDITSGVNQFTATTGDFQTVKVNTIESDDSTSVTVNDGLIVVGNFAFDGGVAVNTILDEDGMGSDSATALATQQSIKAYVDAQDANIASDSLTFTNKTFDANGTGNSITNIEVADLASGVLDTDLSSVSASDDTLASAKAIKAYVDSVAGGTITLGDSASNAGSVDINGNQDLEFRSGDSITLTVSGNGVTAALNDDITVNQIGAKDSSAVSITSPLQSTTIQTSGTITSASSITAGTSFIIGAADINETDLEKIDGITDGTGAANKALVLDASSNISSINTLTATTGDFQTVKVNTIESDDSTHVIINDSLNVDGALDVGSTFTIANGSVGITSILDEDGFASNSATALATQQSIKAYVDSAVGGVSTTSITEGNSSVTVADSGTGTVTVTIDGATHSTFAAAGLSTDTVNVNVLNSTDSTAIQVTDALNVQGAVTSAGGFVGDLTGTASAVADNSVELGTKTTGNYVASLTAGALIDLQNNSGEGATPTIDVDLSELTTSTTDGDGDYFVVVDTLNVQRKLTKANISISGFNTANGIALGTDTTGNYVGTITGGTGIASTGATSGEGIAHTLSVDLNELTTSTSDADGDFFVVVDSVGAQKKLTKANIAISGFNTANGIALGTDTTGNYVAAGAVSGNGLSGSASAEGATFTVTSNATNANTGSTIVFRDGSGNFSAGTITATLSGTATTATNVTATANDTTNETVYLTFVDGQTGAQGIETDVNLTYNPSTNVISSTASAAQYSDLAERFEADAEYEQGTVMVVGGDREVTQSTQEGSADVIGIVSSVTQAGFTMNTGAGSDATHPLIALAGRVQVKVEGTVQKGDRLIASSTPGCARKAELAECTAFNVIGRALETKTTEDVDTVLCFTVARS